MSLLDELDEFEELPIDTKRCSRCGHVLGVEEFYRDIWRPDGYHDYCKTCQTKVNKDYLERKKEERANT